jgi:hypothetical protein
MTIEQQEKTPGQHAEKPSPSPRVPAEVMEELKTRDAAAKARVEAELSELLVISDGLPAGSSIAVQADLLPDIESEPDAGHSDQQKASFGRDWWFKQGRVRLVLQGVTGGRREFVLGEWDHPKIEEGLVEDEDSGELKFVASWEGDAEWTAMLRTAVGEANCLLRAIGTPVRLTLHQKDEETPSTGSEPS